jgi:hypothetical protein
MTDAHEFDDEVERELTEVNDLDELDGDGADVSDDDVAALDDEESRINRTRTDYYGQDLDDEFQPVDRVELSEVDALLDNPERVTEDSGDPVLDPDEVGWDLDADLAEPD